MRSILFVPGHRESWPAKAVAQAADGIILDLEDSVPVAIKVEARAIVAASIRTLAAGTRRVGVYVRVNALETGMTGDDLESVAIPGLDGIVLPKNYGERDVIACDALISHFERRNGVNLGTIEIIVCLETAQAYAACERMLAASPRSVRSRRHGQACRRVPFDWISVHAGGPGNAVLAQPRGAGRTGRRPTISNRGHLEDLNDAEGARRFAEQNRQLGFTGQVLIHPSHIAIANEVFTPSAEDVAFYKGMIEAFEVAEAAGTAAVRYEGQHIDYAHVKTAREVLELHKALTGGAA